MHIVSIMVPVFLLMATGWVLASKQILKPSTEGELIKLVFDVSIPALMFVDIIQNGIGGILNINFAIAYALSILIIFLITALIFKFWKNYKLGQYTMIGMNASISNSTLISMPILLEIFGVQAALPVAAMLIVSMIFIIPFFMFFLELDTNAENVSKLSIVTTAFLRTISQPFIVATILAVIVTKLSVPFPKPIITFLNYLGNTTVPLALIAVGMSLSRVKINTLNNEIAIITFLNLVAKSILAFALAMLFHLPTLYAISLIVVSAAPTANTIYVLAAKYHVYKEETAAIIFLTTILSLLAIPCVIWIASFVWPQV